MSVDLNAFYQDFFQQVQGNADAVGKFAEDAFFDLFCEELVEVGEFDAADRVQYLGARGLRVDGYAGDPSDANGLLTLIVADFDQSMQMATLTASRMDAIFKRLQNFLRKALDQDFRNSLEESSPAFGLADLISARIDSIRKIRLLLITNRLLSKRVDGLPAGEFNDIALVYSVWDIGRLHRLATAGHGREDLVIDLETDFGGPVLLLPAHLEGAGYEAYLAAIPGQQLAEIYDRWGARLLEQNVRCFLQARSKVNRGIRDTIQDEPEMFFAYNNGITATAEGITTRMSDEGLLLTHLTNFQIVNGGQTTASLHAGSVKKNTDLSRVFVQMKLSIVEPDRSNEVVPKISEYANTQNRVNAADFFANHPFHVRMEGFSRRIYAPSAEETFIESKWFYERARGQYQDARAYLTVAQRKQFDREYPRSQMFSKTDLAKFLNLWPGRPDLVSKGAQRNFAEFAREVGRDWETKKDAFNEDFFRRSIVKAIIFRHVEKLVTQQPWYQGGYRANVVAYTIAKFAHVLERRGDALDFESTWRAQAVSPTLDAALTTIAEAVHDVIVSPPEGMRNVTEWAKKEGCWQLVKDRPVSLSAGIQVDLITRKEEHVAQRAAVNDQKVVNEAEAMIAVVAAGADFWAQVKDWAEAERLLGPRDFGILSVGCAIPAQVPSGQQSLILLKILARLQGEGCKLSLAD